MCGRALVEDPVWNGFCDLFQSEQPFVPGVGGVAPERNFCAMTSFQFFHSVLLPLHGGMALLGPELGDDSLEPMSWYGWIFGP